MRFLYDKQTRSSVASFCLLNLEINHVVLVQLVLVVVRIVVVTVLVIQCVQKFGSGSEIWSFLEKKLKCSKFRFFGPKFINAL